MADIKRIALARRTEDIIARLIHIWESAVIETHTFLSRTDIAEIKPDVLSGLMAIECLHCFYDDADIIQGFLGVQNQKIEMLFIDADARGQGIGKQLTCYAITQLNAKHVDVNEQNEQGVGFYYHMGFTKKSRSELDAQGRPFPILHLELGSF